MNETINITEEVSVDASEDVNKKNCCGRCPIHGHDRPATGKNRQNENREERQILAEVME
jgi:hypothetical protein